MKNFNKYFVSFIFACVSVYGSYFAICLWMADVQDLAYTTKKLVPDCPAILEQLGRNYLYNPDALNPSAAKQALAHAVGLSPNDYLLRLTYADALERTGDLIEAQKSLNASVDLAPHYFLPRWLLANLLLRSEKTEESIPLFQQALSITSAVIPHTLELFWQISDKNLKLIERVLPDNKDSQFEYIQFLTRKELYNEAVGKWLSLPVEIRSETEEQSNILVKKLIDASKYSLAWEVWKTFPQRNSLNLVKGIIINGKFDQPIDLNTPGFGWQFDSSEQALISIITNDSHINKQSIAIDYNAPGSLNFVHLKQFVMLEPGHQYKLSYYAYSNNLTTGSLPFVEVIDPIHPSYLQVISSPKLLGSQDWKMFDTVFETSKETATILISIRRNAQCSSDGPCPIFGQVGFSGFNLELLK